MSTVVVSIGSNFLVSLAEDIRRHHEGVDHAVGAQTQAAQSKLEHSIEAGKALNEAKALLKQTGGSWLKWLEMNFTFSDRTAERYMRLAKQIGKIRHTESNPSMRSALKLISASNNTAEVQHPNKVASPRPMSDSHKDAIKAAHTGRIKAKRRNPNSPPIKQNFIPNVPGYLEEMLLTMERCVVDYEITPVDAAAKAIIAHRIKIEHFDEIIDWLTQIKRMVHQTPAEDADERKA